MNDYKFIADTLTNAESNSGTSECMTGEQNILPEPEIANSTSVSGEDYSPTENNIELDTDASYLQPQKVKIKKYKLFKNGVIKNYGNDIKGGKM